MPLKSQFVLRLEATQQTQGDHALASAPAVLGVQAYLDNGTGARQANQSFSDKRTLAASATENLDLSGVLTNALGESVTFTSIKGLVILADAGNVNDVVVGGHATAAWSAWAGDATDKIKVKPGGAIALYAPGAGYAVAATTGDLLTIANSAAGSSVTYSIALIGVN